MRLVTFTTDGALRLGAFIDKDQNIVDLAIAADEHVNCVPSALQLTTPPAHVPTPHGAPRLKEVSLLGSVNVTVPPVA